MLWLTGLFFLTNAAHAAARGATTYAAAFVALAATSYIIHSMPPDTDHRQLIYWLDQLALWCVILIGAYYWQQLPTEQRWVPLAAIAAVAALWFSGAATEEFAFSLDDTKRIPAHGIFHALSSIGHHIILAAL
jgi:hypothetical protein